MAGVYMDTKDWNQSHEFRPDLIEFGSDTASGEREQERKKGRGRGPVRGRTWASAGLVQRAGSGWLPPLFFKQNFFLFQFSKTDSNATPNISKNFTRILFEKLIQKPVSRYYF